MISLVNSIETVAYKIHFINPGKILKDKNQNLVENLFTLLYKAKKNFNYYITIMACKFLHFKINIFPEHMPRRSFLFEFFEAIVARN